eukprot:CAMPEP_0119324244 /NCGR_PEP_ID=MMETSP1333-20130426/62683_1 /TAXON_ID=418940 /ORGANISM="Scyphosphaera apsteinii, Strain RCC1455" /LENGTH=605 /DNA_ID=CAMNT_0007331909 /DNA_START=62 /DNA_END=1879 /DNA_ORIENTATION=+
MTALKITIPIHEEQGWTKSSAPVKTSEEGVRPHPASLRSPETLKKTKERAAQLRQLHLESIKANAQRAEERAAQAKMRRLRFAATEKQRFAEKERLRFRAAEKRALLKEKAAERKELRQERKEASVEALANMAYISNQKAIEAYEREKAAQAKRAKLVQATVNRSAWAVKHAIAVAAATKAKEVASVHNATSLLEDRLALAAFRRASPSEVATERKERTNTRKQIVAQKLHDESVTVEEKRAALARAMDKALLRRTEKIAEKIEKAGLYKERATAVAEARLTIEAESGNVHHGLMKRLQAAEVRRLQLACSRSCLTKEALSFEIDAGKKAGSAPPSATLTLRLSERPTKLASSSDARQKGAATRRATIIFLKLAKLAEREARSCAAAALRAAVLNAVRTKMSTRQALAASAARRAIEARATAARLMNHRVERAADARAIIYKERLKVAAMLAARVARAHANHVAILAQRGALLQPRIVAAEERRVALIDEVFSKSEAAVKRMAAAAERRAQCVAGKVDKASEAKMFAKPCIALSVEVSSMVKVHLLVCTKAGPKLVNKEAATSELVSQEMTYPNLIAMETFSADKDYVLVESELVGEKPNRCVVA